MRARGLARLRVGVGPGALAGDGHHAQAATRSLGSEVRALHEYTCDMSPKRQAMHLSRDRGTQRWFQVMS
eukprot:2420560-Pleurochrysis_carterae.AAC.4